MVNRIFSEQLIPNIVTTLLYTKLKSNFDNSPNQVGWFSGNALNLYTGGALFESRTGYRIF
jgi:hypothetical protein